jgi:hypothetical protein
MQLHPHRRRLVMRAVLHAVAATGLAAAAVLGTGAPGHAADAQRPDSYGGDATATGLHWTVDRNPQPTPVTDLFDVSLPYATSSLDSSGSASATAAPFTPGPGVLGVPGLICQTQVPCASLPPFPSYPLQAVASYPTSQDATATASVPAFENSGVSIAPGRTVAHADLSRVEGTASAGAGSVNGLLTADSATSSTKQSFEGSTLVVKAESDVAGLDVVGQLHVDAVRTVAIARVDGEKVLSSRATTTLTGATLAGQAVTIDETGIHVPGAGDGGQVPSAVNSALAALKANGVTVRLLAPEHQAKDGTASASSGGLLVSFLNTVSLPPPPQLPPLPQLPPPLPQLPQGLPVSTNGDYFGSVTIGGAGVSAFASPALDFSFPSFDVPPFLAAPPVTAPAPGTAVQAPRAPVPPGGLAGGTPPDLATGVHGRPVAVLGVDLSNEKLRTLALVLLGYPALVLLTSRRRLRPAHRG